MLTINVVKYSTNVETKQLLSTSLQNWQVVWEAATICPHPLQVDLRPFDLESGVRDACDVGYVYANFSLPRPLCSWLRPDVCYRQTSDAHHRL